MSETATSSHPSGSPLPDLARAITAGAVRLAAATAAWLRLIAEFDERDGWHGWGMTSCAQWLSWQCGLAPGAAREHVRVARALRSLPRVEAAFADGRLSFSKVRALTRIAEADTEESLLDLAVETTAAQLERFVRSWRRTEDADSDDGVPDRLESRQSFEHWWEDDGTLTITLRMPAEQGADLMAALDSLAEREARRERAQNKKARDSSRPARSRLGTWQEEEELDRPCADDDEMAELARERTAARRLNALASLARVRVDSDRRPGDPPRREVVVHVDADVLAEDTAAGQAHLAGGPALTAAQARRLLCEATVVTMLQRGREPLALGRRRRRASKAQRRALLRRDGGCARPGCPETRVERLHAHHLRHWLFGGRTDLTNLVLLCDTDHGLAHDLGLVMSRHDGRLVVTAPDGRHVWGGADAAFLDGLDGAGGPGNRGGDPGANERITEGTAGEGPRATTADPYTGVHPIDTVIGRRPAADRPGATRNHRTGTAASAGRGRRPAPRPKAAGDGSRAASAPPRRRPGRPAGRPWCVAHRPPRGAVLGTRAAVGDILFPEGEPALPDVMPVNGERMDLRYAVGVLMAHRDFVRRLAVQLELTEVVPARS